MRETDLKEQLGFPVFLKLRNKKIVVLGAGEVAYRRVQSLLHFAENITVVGADISSKMKVLADTRRIQLTEKKVTYSDVRSAFLDDEAGGGFLHGAFIVLACTDDPELNSFIYRICRHKEILSNNCSNREECDFYFPSLVLTDDITIGISGNGSDHRKVKSTREKIEGLIGENHADYHRD